MIRLGVIGAGLRASQMLARMHHSDPEVRVVAVADPDATGAQTSLSTAGAPAENARFFPSAEALLAEADHLDGIVLGTRCNLHAPLAVKAASAGLPLYLEKPVGITMEQLRVLREAYAGRETSVVVAFPLRMSPLFQKVMEVIRSGRLGVVNQVFAYNFVGYGGVYYGQWYRDFDIVGGLWLQKATHDFDYINRLVGCAPTFVAATQTQKIYGGDLPENLRCSECDQTAACPESPANIAIRGDDGGMGFEDHWCAFSKSIRNHDAGAALIGYSDGTHASYSQNFVSRRSAHARGARVTGYEATMEFDWTKGTVRIIEHHGNKIDEIKVPMQEGHAGGDEELSRNFLAVVRKEEPSQSTLTDGILSAAMCLAARASAETGTFRPVRVPGPRAHSVEGVLREKLVPTAMQIESEGMK
jgi:predicted dehydrogenase